MADEYKAFQDEFGLYAALSEYTAEAKENERIIPKARKVVASMHTNPKIQAAILRINDPEKFGAISEKRMKGQKSKLEGLVDDDGKKETILKQMEDEEIAIALQILPQKESYAGGNASTYEAIAKDRKVYIDLAKIRASEDFPEMDKKNKEYAVSGLSDIDKEAYEILSQVDARLIVDLFEDTAKTFQDKYTTALENHERDFINATLNPGEFIDFYAALKNTQAELEKEKQRQSRSGNGNKRRRPA